MGVTCEWRGGLRETPPISTTVDEDALVERENNRKRHKAAHERKL